MSGKKEAAGTFVAIERYANGAAIKTHVANPVSLCGGGVAENRVRGWVTDVQHFKEFGKKVGPLLAKQTELSYYDEIDDSAKL